MKIPTVYYDIHIRGQRTGRKGGGGAQLDIWKVGSQSLWGKGDLGSCYSRILDSLRSFLWPFLGLFIYMRQIENRIVKWGLQ